MNKPGLILLSMNLSSAPVVLIAADADADAGKAKAAPCLACHFADDFTGESEADILALINATQAPDSEHPLREGEGEGDLDETAIADIAAFFARGEVVENE